VTTVYDPAFALSADKKSYIAVNNNTPTTIPARAAARIAAAAAGNVDQVTATGWRLKG